MRDMLDKGYEAAKLHYLEEKGGLLGHILSHSSNIYFDKAVPIQCLVEKFEGLPYYYRLK